MSTARIDFGALMEPVARYVLGHPNQELSTDKELRFGTRGSVSVPISGDHRGVFFDHEAGVGGGLLDLLKHKLSLVDGKAFDWLRQNRFIPADQAKRQIVATYDYRDALRLDVHNGLLLSALWDAAFDSGLVSFADDGTVLLSPRLGAVARTALASAILPLLPNLTPAHCANLSRHRRRHGF